MKYAIFADIHANLEALHSVLRDAELQNCSELVCLGDIVGFGPSPHPCAQLIRLLECPVVLGDADEVSAADSSLAGLCPRGTWTTQWTRRHLKPRDREWLAGLQLVERVGDFTIVHATLDTPGGWGYVTNKFDAMASFSYQQTRVCFFGHTHRSESYAIADDERWVEPGETAEFICIEPGYRYFINPGAVGFSRDGDWRAAYSIYDTDQQIVHCRRLEYDRETMQRKLLESGLWDIPDFDP